MSTGDTDQEHTAGINDPAQDHIEGREGQEPTGDTKPAPDEEHVAKAKDIKGNYDDDRPTVVLPGSDGTVSGTAINDWLDDDGNAIDHSKDVASDTDG